MRKVVLLGLLWTVFIVELVSASAVINCLDNNCYHVRVVLQEVHDVNEVSQKHPRAREVDFHGNLLDGYQQPSSAQWKKLNLSYNLLTQDMFSNIRSSHLEAIDLTYNRLSRVSVPSSVTDFIAERNQLHDITIGTPSRLRRLILPKNQFESLDKFINLADLQELDLSCNDLNVVNVDKLPGSLRTLKLARNHIHTISGLKSLQSLEYLDLSHNILTTFQDSTTIFPNVKRLYLQNNKIVMWMDVSNTRHQFQEVNLLDNDWDCKHLKIVLGKTNGKEIQTSRATDIRCEHEHNSICCTPGESPYADRLIKYRKQQFKALQEGTAQRIAGNFSCSKYQQDPCDGDDNLVYKVAGSAIKTAKSLAESSIKELEQTLQQEKNLVDKLERNVTSFRVENDQLSRTHSDLVAYIGRQYEEALPQEEQSLNGKPNEEVGKLQELFNYFEREKDNLKQQIDAEERRHQDKLDEINTLQKEIGDLDYQKDRMTEEVNKRNATVNGYKLRIEALQKQLG